MVSAFLLTAIMALGLFSSTATATPASTTSSYVSAPSAVPAIYNDGSDTGASDWWFAKIKRQGTVAYSTENADGYSIFRNVKDFGAKGDGLADDTAAINDAISSGNRCGLKCDPSTVTPAIIYFPPGTYRVSAPIVMYYYSHMVGDALSLPVIKATSDFAGMAVMDSNPYDNNGNN
ncbi:exo-beta-1,3-glucanase Exg0 [Ceratocystis lukuohia]|uniref:Exo-beta-1,3-glucanase Exg0 n=1 Tax=Ceratocystis lukuohia TaxID=2019550 RepID=A0ABR4MA96_9PEZI